MKIDQFNSELILICDYTRRSKILLMLCACENKNILPLITTYPLPTHLVDTIDNLLYAYRYYHDSHTGNLIIVSAELLTKGVF